MQVWDPATREITTVDTCFGTHHLNLDDEDVMLYDWKIITGISMDLQGGRADTQIAYICLYKKIEITKDRAIFRNC